MKSSVRHQQSGASLIEVLVALGLFSVGILALGVVLSFAVQLPKLAAYRATATHLASSHVERIRANPGGNYNSALNYDATFTALQLANCAYPMCTSATLVEMDSAFTQNAARTQLPAGGLQVNCDGVPCASGNLWIVWQEPSTFATLNPSTSDNCPSEVTGKFSTPKPRCLHLKFKI